MLFGQNKPQNRSKIKPEKLIYVYHSQCVPFLCIGVIFNHCVKVCFIIFSDYIELAIQFGFATLFSSAFPLAPLCAFLNNLFEIRLDAQKYTKYKMRTVPNRKRYDIFCLQPTEKFELK